MNQDTEMDRRQENWHISKSINISVLITLALCTISTVAFVAGLDNKVDTLKSRVDKHNLNMDAHMPYGEKIKVFVPRVELDGRFVTIEKDLDEIKQMIRDLER